MKKEYESPELEFVLITLTDELLSPSQYNPDPEDPKRDGDDRGSGELFP